MDGDLVEERLFAEEPPDRLRDRDEEGGPCLLPGLLATRLEDGLGLADAARYFSGLLASLPPALTSFTGFPFLGGDVVGRPDSLRRGGDCGGWRSFLGGGDCCGCFCCRLGDVERLAASLLASATSAFFFSIL